MHLIHLNFKISIIAQIYHMEYINIGIRQIYTNIII